MYAQSQFVALLSNTDEIRVVINQTTNINHIFEMQTFNNTAIPQSHQCELILSNLNLETSTKVIYIIISIVIYHRCPDTPNGRTQPSPMMLNKMVSNSNRSLKTYSKGIVKTINIHTGMNIRMHLFLKKHNGANGAYPALVHLCPNSHAEMIKKAVTPPHRFAYLCYSDIDCQMHINNDQAICHP